MMTFTAEMVHGVWILVSAVATDAEGHELPEPYGPTPMGSLTLAPSGRMMAVLCDGRPSLPDGTRRAYASYCGNFEIRGDRLITTVDAALDPARIGGQQVRRLRRQGDDLVLLPPPRDGEQRELVWRRIGDA